MPRKVVRSAADSESHIFPQTSDNDIASSDEVTGHLTGVIAGIVWAELHRSNPEIAAEKLILVAATTAIAICNAVAEQW